MRLEEIATDQLVIIEPADSVKRAFKLMVENDIRHLPVVDDGRVVGIVSERDLLMIVYWISAWKSLTEQKTSVGNKRVSQLMSSPVTVLSPDDSIEQAALLMLEGHLSAVPLERDGSIVSIVTESDILRCYLDDSAPSNSRPWCNFEVADHMTETVVTAKLTDHVLPSFNLMKERQIRHMPVMDGDKLAGLISDRDLRRSYGQEIALNLARDTPDSEQPKQFTLEDCMSRTIEKVDRHATLAHAASRMVHCKIGALPVTDRDDLIGIITETDLLRVFAQHSNGE